MTDELLPPDERELWRGFLSWTHRVISEVGRELADHSGLSVQDLEILGRLWERDGRLEQQELLAWLRWSPSRLSHQLTRMSERGLLTREATGSGRRLTVALTEDGADQTAAAVPYLAVAVRRHFLAALDADQRAALRSLTGE